MTAASCLPERAADGLPVPGAPPWRLSSFARSLSRGSRAAAHSVAMRRVAGAAGRALRHAGRRLDGGLGVSSSAAAEAAAAPAAAAGAKPSTIQEFKIYRWNPEVAGDKPKLQTYKARRRRRRRRVPVFLPACRATPRWLPKSTASAPRASRSVAAREQRHCARGPVAQGGRTFWGRRAQPPP